MKTKQQQAKNKELGAVKTTSQEGVKRSYTNPKGSEYERFLRSGKWINHLTSCREDPDGYRIRRNVSGGEPTFHFIGDAGRGYRRYIKKSRSM